jgi:hypothetical protein
MVSNNVQQQIRPNATSSNIGLVGQAIERGLAEARPRPLVRAPNLQQGDIPATG